MGAMASRITSLTIVYSTFYSGTDQRKHESSASLAFVQGIHRWPVNSPHKWPVTRKMFPFDDVIMLSIIPGYLLLEPKSSNILPRILQWHHMSVKVSQIIGNLTVCPQLKQRFQQRSASLGLFLRKGLYTGNRQWASKVGGGSMTSPWMPITWHVMYMGCDATIGRYRDNKYAYREGYDIQSQWIIWQIKYPSTWMYRPQNVHSYTHFKDSGRAFGKLLGNLHTSFRPILPRISLSKR